jgi:non-lysosomal glucosylceramidase
VVALSGFSYDGITAAVVAVPRIAHANFQCFWSTATGWGTFAIRTKANAAHLSIKVLSGTLACRSCEIAAAGSTASVAIGGRKVESDHSQQGGRTVVTLRETSKLAEDDEIHVEVRG